MDQQPWSKDWKTLYHVSYAHITKNQRLVHVVFHSGKSVSGTQQLQVDHEEHC